MQTARLFTDGNSQAVRLPEEFRFEGDEVVIKKVGNTVILLPKVYAYRDLKALLDEIGPLGLEPPATGNISRGVGPTIIRRKTSPGRRIMRHPKTCFGG